MRRKCSFMSKLVKDNKLFGDREFIDPGIVYSRIQISLAQESASQIYRQYRSNRSTQWWTMGQQHLN